MSECNYKKLCGGEYNCDTLAIANNRNCHHHIRFFLSKGDIDARDSEGWTSLHHACHNNDTFMTDFLLENGANPNAKSNEGSTPLQCCFYRIHAEPEECVNLLLKKGAFHSPRDDTNDTPLHMSSFLNRPKCIISLLFAGADPRSLNRRNETPSDLAKSEMCRSILNGHINGELSLIDSFQDSNWKDVLF